MPRSDWDEAPPRRGAERQLLIRWVGFRGVGWGGVEFAFKFGIQVLPRIYFQLGLLLLLAIGGFKSGPRLQGFRLECLGLIWGLGFRA